MNRRIIFLTLVSSLLAACAGTSTQHGRPAPVLDLPTGPSGIQPRAREPKVEPTPVLPAAEQTKGAYLVGDGPGTNEPINVDNTPDAVPKAEPLHRYANRPYIALGKTYTPLVTVGTYKEVGIASWYGKKFHGQRTSIGDTYDMYGMTASHPTLPIPSYARITNVLTGKSVIVRVNDRGPFLHDRIIDLSYAAAHKLGIINNGTGQVQVESLAVNATERHPEVALLPPPIKSEPIPDVVTPPVIIFQKAPETKSATVSVSKAIPAASKLYLRFGVFKSEKIANRFLVKLHAKLGSAGKSLRVHKNNNLNQVVMGPFATQKEAIAEGKKLKMKLGFKRNIQVHKLS